jgi:O-antigen/teichoic acid export membrane protein
VLSRSESVEDRQKKIQIYGNFIFIVGAIVSLIIMVFPDFFIHTVYGMKYEASIPILQILMGTVMIMYLNTIYYPPLVSWKYEKTVMYAIALGGVVNIVLNYALIPPHGAVGAAWSTVASELTVLAGLLFIVKRVIKKVFIIKKLAILFLALVATFFGYFLIDTFDFNTIITGIVIIIIYFLLILLFKIVTIEEIKKYISK